jgi:hypothetical protein
VGYVPEIASPEMATLQRSPRTIQQQPRFLDELAGNGLLACPK